MHVLIIGPQGDGHVELVSRHLTKSHTFIDTFSIRDGETLSFTTEKDRTRIIYAGRELSDVTAVWCYRLAIDFNDPKYKVKKSYEEYSHAAVRNFINSLTVSFEKAFWISPYHNMLMAVNKQFHLNRAREIGFNVPETLITSDPRAAREFVDSREVTIVKPFSPKISSSVSSGNKFFFATKVFKGEPLDLDALPAAPVIFQTAIDPVCDIRVFVVGNKIFTASITGNESSKERYRDWRMAQFDGSLNAEAHALPKSIEHKCIKLVKDMGLVYGAVDMLLDKHGKYWFLEVNTTGAWRFIEDRTKQPIAATIAKMLDTAGKKN